MNKIAILSLSTLGGAALFAVSFLGFAKLNGVPLNELPLVGGMLLQMKLGLPTYFLAFSTLLVAAAVAAFSIRRQQPAV